MMDFGPPRIDPQAEGFEHRLLEAQAEWRAADRAWKRAVFTKRGVTRAFARRYQAAETLRMLRAAAAHAKDGD